jgi:hypothetical protein
MFSSTDLYDIAQEHKALKQAANSYSIRDYIEGKLKGEGNFSCSS